MTAKTDLARALETLHRKLEALDTLTEANGFLVRAMREHEPELKRMSEQETRDMLRLKARAEYGGTDRSPARSDASARGDANVSSDATSHSESSSKALAVIEETLGTGQSAQIIPFPKRR